MTPLEMATNDELIDELFKRSDAGGVILRLKEGSLCCRCTGDNYHSLGLLTHMQDWLLTLTTADALPHTLSEDEDDD